MKQRYCTPREVADQLRVSPTTVMKLIHDGRLYAVRVSERIYRVPVGAVSMLHAGNPKNYDPTEESVEALPPLGEPVDARRPAVTSARR